ncbi:helix-turn-helix domain-containing protein [Dyella sp. C9]|uniref:helix-turn-helix domain-containing protein n=1 Tax=Dyella sp. C9 TaxID=2202154 RepID=UPI0018E4F824|nr:helix-turn-helix domain-containing protein [Dyella sp. C9]
MAIAKRLLRDDDLEITQIAERVDYSSSSTFTVAFTRQVDLSPARYGRSAQRRSAASRQAMQSKRALSASPAGGDHRGRRQRKTDHQCTQPRANEALVGQRDRKRTHAPQQHRNVFAGSRNVYADSGTPIAPFVQYTASILPNHSLHVPRDRSFQRLHPDCRYQCGQRCGL